MIITRKEKRQTKAGTGVKKKDRWRTIQSEEREKTKDRRLYTTATARID